MSRPPRFRLEPLTHAHAVELTRWRYPPPYAVYGFDDADPAWLADPEAGFHAVLDETATLVGFRSFGADGRVPGFDYDADDRVRTHTDGGPALDTGGGLRPDLTGQGAGYGRAVIAAGLDYGRALLDPPAFRVTVAAFNARALRVVEQLGFERVARFESTPGDGSAGRRFEVLVRGQEGAA